VWRIDELEDGESVLAVAPVLGGNDFTRRLVLTDRRILTIRSAAMASMFGLARYARSTIVTSTRLNQVKSAAFTSSMGGFASSLEIDAEEGLLMYHASGIGSRWLRLLSARIPETPQNAG
jgi:hypothetical protein